MSVPKHSFEVCEVNLCQSFMLHSMIPGLRKLSEKLKYYIDVLSKTGLGLLLCCEILCEGIQQCVLMQLEEGDEIV